MKKVLAVLVLTFGAVCAQANCADAIDVVSRVLENITELATDCPGADPVTKREYRRLGRENISLLGRAARNCQNMCRGTHTDAVQFCREVEADAPRMGRQLDAKCS